MNTYTTLGEGKKTAVLFTNADGTQRKVTSLDHATARRLASRLDRCYETLPSALYDVAVTYNGKPASARRRLLNVFDTGVVPDEPCWQLAAGVVRDLAAAAAGQPDAVTVAVRRELVEAALGGIDDGILVSGILVAFARRPTYLKLVVNPAMTPWHTSSGEVEDLFFDGIDAGALALAEVEQFDDFEGCDYYGTNQYLVVDALRGISGAHLAEFGEGSAEEIFAESGNEIPQLLIEPRQLRAWMEANRPDLVETYPTIGA